MEKSNFYRFLSGGKGIYEAVDLDCPRSDFRRIEKPDGSWLEKVGTQHPGAISFWTEQGLMKYLESGLQDWHRRVVKNPVFVQILQGAPAILYQDSHQIICRPEEITYPEILSWENFASQRAAEKMVEKVVGYVTRYNHELKNEISDELEDENKELLVFDHDREFKEAGTQVPAGTVDFGESLEAALFREIEEESGLTGLRIKKKIDEYVLYRVPQQQFNRRHVFELESLAPLPDRWTHVVTGNGEDNKLNFHYYWIPLKSAHITLSGGLGESIKKSISARSL